MSATHAFPSFSFHGTLTCVFTFYFIISKGNFYIVSKILFIHHFFIRDGIFILSSFSFHIRQFSTISFKHSFQIRPGINVFQCSKFQLRNFNRARKTGNIYALVKAISNVFLGGISSKKSSSRLSRLKPINGLSSCRMKTIER